MSGVYRDPLRAEADRIAELDREISALEAEVAAAERELTWLAARQARLRRHPRWWEPPSVRLGTGLVVWPVVTLAGGILSFFVCEMLHALR
jgi:hypothetical protein